MENKIKLTIGPSPYSYHFNFAQVNLEKFIEDERIQKRIQRSKRRLTH